MFATVRFGANCQEMVNLLCSVQTLTGHLKWKCQCRPEGEENSEAICYESLLEDLGKHYPELPAGKQLWRGLVTPQIGCSSSQQRPRGQSRGRRAPCRGLSLTPAPEPGTGAPHRARGAWNTRAPLDEGQTHHWSAQPPPGSYSSTAEPPVLSPSPWDPLSPSRFTHPKLWHPGFLRFSEPSDVDILVVNFLTHFL
nr:uncharacterized protein C22orf15 homolog isoform X3 [Zonotrichia albicollis]